jgi:hypothetical protein
MYRAIRRLARIDLELLEEPAKADPGPLVANSDSDCAVLVVHAQRDHGPLEARVGHSGHRQEKLSGQEGRRMRHKATMRRQVAAGKS